MKVILLKEVKSLGYEGDVVSVSDGYARNFLFPQNLATQASAEAIRQIENKKKIVSAKEKKELKTAKSLASKLEGQEVTLKLKASEEGTLFAAVSRKDVLKACKYGGFKVEESWIRFAEPIKEVGEHEIVLDLPAGLKATIILIVEGK